MIMRYRPLFALTLVGAWGLSALSCIADDAERCASAAGREGITACDSVIASGRISGRGLASAHYNRGLSWFEAGQYDRAIADYNESIRLDPASASSFNNRGSAWYAKGKADRALADFEKAIELDPAYVRAYNNRAEVFNAYPAFWGPFSIIGEGAADQRDALPKTVVGFADDAALSDPQSPAVKEIQDLLSRGEALLVYAAGEKESYVFAVTRQSAAWKPIALGTAAMSEKVAAFRGGLDVAALQQSAAAGKPVLFDLGLANELYVSLIGPVEDLIKDARHVLVVPSGPLTSLPFRLLVTEKPATAIPQLKDIGSYLDAAWLIKRHAVSVLPTLASLKALRQSARRDAGAKPLVGFGDPVFDQAAPAEVPGASIGRAKPARPMPPLPEAAGELREVAAKLGASAGDVHLGSDATETAVKRTALADYRVVYFATYGLRPGDVAGLREPALALTSPKQPTELDDGLLTASEVAQLRLNADLVVLSADNTTSLARAFFDAGARAVLAADWSVDSEAATRLTTSTFAVMKANPKLGRAEALRNAMLAYMNDKSRPLNAYPAFWGPFSIIGEGAAR
jgi:CHAT domain-containing protein